MFVELATAITVANLYQSKKDKLISYGYPVKWVDAYIHKIWGF